MQKLGCRAVANALELQVSAVHQRPVPAFRVLVAYNAEAALNVIGDSSSLARLLKTAQDISRTLYCSSIPRKEV